uniref:HNH endonuclease n=1 Tax=Candidatus Electrothrix sp. TaxID=2170559 RepID=UPI0040572459
MRRCLLKPIAAIDTAANYLDSAADAILAGDKHLASKLISKADIPEIMEYAVRLVGKMSIEVHRQIKKPKSLPKSMRHPTRMPSQKIQNEIFASDGWKCRFCGSKVISRRARNVIVKLFPNETHWDTKEFEKHSALYAMSSSLDHVIPHSRGGKNELSNFVTACYCCQFGRGQWTIEESELYDPRNYKPCIDEWDGLKRLDKYKMT